MTKLDKTYFIAKGRSLEAIEKADKSLKEGFAKMQDYCEELGLERWAFKMYQDTGQILGVTSKEKPAVGWRYLKRQDVWVPDRRLKSGKKAALRLDECRVMSAWKLEQMLGFDGFKLRPGSLVSLGINFVGDEWIITVPHEPGTEPHHPPDAERIKKSEYWLKVEAEKGG